MDPKKYSIVKEKKTFLFDVKQSFFLNEKLSFLLYPEQERHFYALLVNKDADPFSQITPLLWIQVFSRTYRN